MADSKTSNTKNSKQQDLTTANQTPFIDSGSAFDAYDESRKWLRPYFDPLAEFERIARNKPSDKISDELPKITDGTMASIVQEQPKRIIQQVPTGLVTCKDYPEYAKIADIVLFQELIPMYNRMGDMLQKSWNMVGKAMTWGSSGSYTFYTSTSGKLHTDFVVPYRKDLLSEKGKVFAPDSNVSFMRSWYQKRDLQAIINRETMMEKEIKGYKSDWDLPKLSKFMESGASAKPADLQTPAEKEKGGDTGGYEVIHCFQEGVGAEFYSIAPRMAMEKGASGSAGVLRRKVNKDPRGKMPIDWLYCNIDLSNPVGRGQVELSGGVQNLIDQQMQMFQFMTTMMMGPPLQVWGDVNKASLKFRPNAIWNMGANPNNSLVKPFEINNNAIANFPNNYGLLKSQILNLNSAQDHSISADAGNPQQSKTQAGVAAAEQRLGVSDNYLRKQYEAWFERQSETSINVYFSEMQGEKTIKLEGDELNEIMKTDAKQYVDKKTGVLTIPYKKINDVVFKFAVDASTSEVKEDQGNADKLTEVLKVMQAVPDPNIQAKIPQVIKLIIDEIGAEGTDDLFPELDKKNTDQNGQPAQGQPATPQGPDPQQLMQMVQAMVQQAMQQEKANDPGEHPIIKLMETLQIKFESLPADAQQQVLAMIGINSTMPSPSTTALDQKQQDLNMKAQAQQQNADTNATKTALDVAKTAHQHTMDLHNAAHTVANPQQPTQGAENGNANPQSANSPQNPTANPQNGQAPALNDALTPDEEQVVQQLLHRGFNEQDAEQAIVMLRQGVPADQVTQTLGAKYAH